MSLFSKIVFSAPTIIFLTSLLLEVADAHKLKKNTCCHDADKDNLTCNEDTCNASGGYCRIYDGVLKKTWVDHAKGAQDYDYDVADEGLHSMLAGVGLNKAWGPEEEEESASGDTDSCSKHYFDTVGGGGSGGCCAFCRPGGRDCGSGLTCYNAGFSAHGYCVAEGAGGAAARMAGHAIEEVGGGLIDAGVGLGEDIGGGLEDIMTGKFDGGFW